MDPSRLAVWTSIGINSSTYKPTNKQILERYLLKFSKGVTKGGKAVVADLHKDDLGLLDPTGDEEGEGWFRLPAPRRSDRGSAESIACASALQEASIFVTCSRFRYQTSITILYSYAVSGRYAGLCGAR